MLTYIFIKGLIATSSSYKKCFSEAFNTACNKCRIRGLQGVDNSLQFSQILLFHPLSELYSPCLMSKCTAVPLQSSATLAPFPSAHPPPKKPYTSTPNLSSSAAALQNQSLKYQFDVICLCISVSQPLKYILSSNNKCLLLFEGKSCCLCCVKNV